MSAADRVDERHLSPAGLSRYLAEQVSIELPIAGEPPALLFIDARTPALGLRVHHTSEDVPPNTNLQHLVVRRTWHDGTRCLEVLVTEQTLFRDAYTFLCAMADRIQVDKMRPVEALRVTLRKLSLLLRQHDRLSQEREVGLFGELLVLGGLIEALGADDALGCWRGGASEEHDFGLSGVDVEVKTTTTERRTHWIGSWTQLVPTGRRPLWVVSHQLTQAGLDDGLRLPDLIDLLRGMVFGRAAEALEAGLSGAGWTDGHGAGFEARWVKRAESRAYAVTDAFPRLTPDLLDGRAFSAVHVPEVTYRIDLTGLQHHAPTDALRLALAFEGRR